MLTRGDSRSPLHFWRHMRRWYPTNWHVLSNYPLSWCKILVAVFTLCNGYHFGSDTIDICLKQNSSQKLWLYFQLVQRAMFDGECQVGNNIQQIKKFSEQVFKRYNSGDQTVCILNFLFLYYWLSSPSPHGCKLLAFLFILMKKYIIQTFWILNWYFELIFFVSQWLWEIY